MARRPSTAESVPATVNKPDHIIISFALSASVSRHATNRSSRLPRRNHASNRSGRRWRGCRSPETVSGMTAGNSRLASRPRGSARSQLQLPSRRPDHQKRPHLFLRCDITPASYRTNHEQKVKRNRCRGRARGDSCRRQRPLLQAKADAEKSQARWGARRAGDSVEAKQKFLGQPDSQPGGAVIEICFKISRSGFSS
jgi:hypothetical protein